jgi:hypothetical protein
VKGISKSTHCIVSRRVWAPGDEYLVIGEIQVMEHEGFKAGDRVTVIITKEETK